VGKIKVVFGPYEAESKTALRQAVRNELAPYQMGQPFTSHFMSELMANRHPYCALHQLRPTTFVKALPHGGHSSYHFTGYFPQSLAWHALSWNKCIDQPTYDMTVKAFFRWHISPAMFRAKEAECIQCGSDDRLQVDHVSPTFVQICQQVMPLFKPEERNVWAFYNWDDDPGFQLPLDHPAFVEFRRLHSNGKLQTLCTPCHQAITKLRKSTP